MGTLPRLANAVFPNWVDAAGGQANSMWTIADQGDDGPGPYADLLDAAQNLSAASNFSVVIQRRAAMAGTIGSSAYPLVQDQVIFFVQSVSSQSQIVVPAPIDTIFLSDNQTVDMTNSDVMAFVTEILAVLGDSYGNPWLTCTGGRRRMIRLAGT